MPDSPRLKNMDGNAIQKKINQLTEVDFTVESIYHCASVRPETHSSDGGLPVEDRWWDALYEAFNAGREYERRQLKVERR